MSLLSPFNFRRKIGFTFQHGKGLCAEELWAKGGSGAGPALLDVHALLPPPCGPGEPRPLSPTGYSETLPPTKKATWTLTPDLPLGAAGKKGRENFSTPSATFTTPTPTEQVQVMKREEEESP